MINNIIIVSGFIVVLIGLCKGWNLYAMNQYKKRRDDKLNLVYSLNMISENKIEIEGVGIDENGDFNVSQAIKKIEMLNDIRIKGL